MARRLFLIVSFIMIFLLFLSACSMRSEDSGYEIGTSDMATQNRMDYGEADVDEEASDGSGIRGNIEPEKIITTINLGFETESFDGFVSNLEDLIEENNGYIEYSDIWYGGTSRAYRRGEYSIRIPRDNMSRFKDNVGEIGNLLNESTNRQDVTSQYRDTESRLRVIETKENRILALLEEADLMADIIELERELSNIIYEKEFLTSQLMGLDDRIDYSTININVEEVERYTSREDLDTGLATRIKNALNDSLHFFITTLESLVIFFIYFIPFLIVIVILAFISKKVYEKYRKK